MEVVSHCNLKQFWIFVPVQFSNARQKKNYFLPDVHSNIVMIIFVGKFYIYFVFISLSMTVNQINLSKTYSLIYFLFYFLYMKTIFLDRLLKNITNNSKHKWQQKSSCILNINILVALILLTS